MRMVSPTGSERASSRAARPDEAWRVSEVPELNRWSRSEQRDLRAAARAQNAGVPVQYESFLHTWSPISPLIQVALTHARFETINPFLDGNGRMAPDAAGTVHRILELRDRTRRLGHPAIPANRREIPHPAVEPRPPLRVPLRRRIAERMVRALHHQDPIEPPGLLEPGGEI